MTGTGPKQEILKRETGTVILAAGNSERMGSCKFLLQLKNGKSFLKNIIDAFSGAGFQKISVVTQQKYLQDVQQACKGASMEIQFAVNNHPEKERFYSLQLGLRMMPDIEFCFIHNADSPFIDEAVLNSLFAHRREADVIIPEFNNKGGHPVLINRNVIDQLISLPENTILRDALMNFRRAKVRMKNRLVTVDIDTPEDYKRYCS